MEKSRKRTWVLAAALVLGSCGYAAGGASPHLDDGGAWMDGSDVVVTQDLRAGREYVTLVDGASGLAQVVDDEPLTPAADEFDDPAGVQAAAATRTAAPTK